MKARSLLAASLTLALTAPALAAPALAAEAPNVTRNCFQPQEWQDWRGANDKTFYVRVHNHDVWRVDLSGGSSLLTDETSHLVSNLKDTDWVCHASDLNDLKIVNSGITIPLFVKAITKLTPEQVAALPEKDRP